MERGVAALFYRQKSLMVFALILLFLLGLISAQIKSPSGRSLLGSIIFSAFSPIQVASANIVEGIKDRWQAYIDLRNLYQENQVLKQKIVDLQYKLLTFNEFKLDNERLRLRLGFIKKLPVPNLFAEVIALDSSSFSRTIIINKGSQQGLKLNMPVICPQGVVGKVIRISLWAAQVQLIIDGNSALAAMDQRSRVRGVVVGLGKHYCHLKYVDVLQDVAVGDTIITSGEDGIFPKGLMIGKIVSSRQKGSLLKEISLIPVANFQKLEEVLILLKKEEALPFSSQGK